MSNKHKWVVQLVTQIVKDETVAETVVDALMEEGVLHVGYGNADVDIVVKKFTDTFGTTKVSKYDRWAALRLANKYGSQAVCGIMQLLSDHATEKYAPVVNSVADLESKWVSVVNFIRNLKQGEEIDV